MDDRNRFPAPRTLTRAVSRRLRRHAAEEDGGGCRMACTGKRCQSCTAGVIADCVAVCCCPCAVVNLLVLAFLKLPWAVARKCLGGRSGESRRRIVEGRKSSARDRDGISEKERAEEEKLKIGGIGEEELNVNLSADQVWLDLCEFGHLGFGRVSFTGANLQ